MRRLLGLLGVVLAIGLASGLLAGCGGGPPKFQPGPGKVRATPIPAGHGEVNYPANVTVDGTGLYVFTHGLRKKGADYQVNLSAIPNPTGPHPGQDAVQAWLGRGQTMRVAGLTVKVLAVYPGDGISGSADLQVTAGSSTGPSSSSS